MKMLFVATGNLGKLAEIKAILDGLEVELVTPDQFPNLPDVEEDGTTFEQNAVKKARSAAQATGLPSLADDSGLAVDVLHGRPGVFSARYAGEGASDGANIARLLQDISLLPSGPKTAHFVCVTALCLPDGSCTTFRGELHGEIISEPAGDNGFGYDPVFYLPGYGLTLAQLAPEQKNRISHRAAALASLREYLSAPEVPAADGG